MRKKLLFWLFTLLLVAGFISADWYYNPATGKIDYYEPVSGATFETLSNVTLTGATAGNVLYYNGTAWVNLATGANTEVLTLTAGAPTWAAAGAPGAHAATHELLGADLVDHDNLTNFAANEHFTQANITTVGTIGTGIWQGTDVGVAHGGTGRSTSTTAYGLLAAGTTATNPHQTLAAGLATQILVGGGAAALPAWGTDIPTAVTVGGQYNYRAGGTDVAVADGGTGLGSYTTGDILYASGAGTLAGLADVAVNQVLVSGGVGVAPAYSATPTLTDITATGKVSAATYGSDGSITDAEFLYINTLSSNAQTQITGKQASDAALTDLSSVAVNAGRYIRVAGADDFEERTVANVLADIGAAASAHNMASHSDEDTYNISTSGTITSTNTITGTFGAAHKLFLNATGVTHTDTAGILDINMIGDTGTVGADINITSIATGLGDGETIYGISIPLNADADDHANSTLIGINLGYTPNASPGKAYGIYANDADLDYAIFVDAGDVRFDGTATIEDLAGTCIGNDVQAYNAVLTELTALTDPAADKFPFWNDTTNNFEFSAVITPTATGVTVGVAGNAGKLELEDATGDVLGISVGIQAGNTDYVWPTAFPVTGQILSSTDAGVMSWVNNAADAFTVKVDAGATAGYLGVAAGDGVLRTSNSIGWTDGGDFVTLDVTEANVDHNTLSNYAANEHIDWEDTAGAADNFGTSGFVALHYNAEVRFYDNGNYVGFEAPALGANQIWVLPATDGAAGTFLKTDAAGNLAWQAAAGGGTVTTVMHGGVGVGDADIIELDFLAADFVIVEGADTHIDISLDYPNSQKATTAQAGILTELATIAETNTGTDTARAVTPDGLDGWTGSAQITTLGTIATGIWNAGAVTVADGSSISLQEDITFTGATGVNLIKFPDNLAEALVLEEAGTSYQTFVSTDNSEEIQMNVGVQFDTIAYFDAVYDEGAESGAFTIDWTNGQKQKVTITGVALDMSFTDPPGPCNLMLEIIQGDGDDTIDWTHDTKIGGAGGTAPTLSTGAADTDCFAIYWDGAKYVVSVMLDTDLFI